MISQSARKIRGGLVRDVLDETPIELKRKQWEVFAREQPTPSGVNVQHLELAGVPCLLCTGEQPSSNTMIVYCHGGGLEGSVETHRTWTCRLALHTGCKVLSVQYRLAPEHPYPAGVEDVLSVCNALTFDKSFAGSFCIGADSTGCILGLLALIKLKSQKSIKPGSAFFLSPSIDLTFSGASIESNASLDPLVSLDVLRHYAKLYAAGKDMYDSEISPLFAQLRDIPPILIMADDQEILLDDATRLARNVTDAGGIAKLHLTHGLWHAWPMYGDFPESAIALDLISQHVLHPSGD